MIIDRYQDVSNIEKGKTKFLKCKLLMPIIICILFISIVNQFDMALWNERDLEKANVTSTVLDTGECMILDSVEHLIQECTQIV